MNNRTDEKIKALEKKIKTIKGEEVQVVYHKPNLAPVANIAIELLAGIIVGLIVGLLVDDFFSSRPVFLIVCLILSMIATFKLIWKRYM